MYKDVKVNIGYATYIIRKGGLFYMKGKSLLFTVLIAIFIWAASIPIALCANQGSDPSEKTKNPINLNDTGKTVIKTISQNHQYPNNSYMIISQNGTVVVADPYDVVLGITPDIITVTHSHFDHNDPKLISISKCRKSIAQPGEKFTIKDVTVTSIASSHLGQRIDQTDPTNVIYVFEVDGLRIAHMGDIGQDKFTDEQLKALGKIDIAFMQFVNSYSDYSAENGKGFRLIEQLKPQIIIPTHSSPDATRKIGNIVGTLDKIENILVTSSANVADTKRRVIDITNTLAN